jgi:xylan 1,4-beta-xylosidase
VYLMQSWFTISEVCIYLARLSYLRKYVIKYSQEIIMKQECVDEFKTLDLPFETHISTCVDHDDVAHEDMEFVWVIEGAVNIVCEKKLYVLTADTVFMIYMNQNHSITSKQGSLMISIRMKKDYLVENKLYFDKIPFRNRVYSFKELAHKYHEVPLIISQIVLLLTSRGPFPNIRYKIIGYYNMFIYDLYSVRMQEKYLDIKKKNYDEYLIRFHKVIEYINTNYAKKITLDSLAQLVNISSFRVSHFISERLGISVQEYIQDVRFEHALLQLKNTNLPIKEIVIRCGFSDAKYLNVMMKKKFHITAFRYRKIMKDNDSFGIKGYSYPKLVNELTNRLQLMDRGVYMDDTFGLRENIKDSNQDSTL